jgi:hypothetical protein
MTKILLVAIVIVATRATVPVQADRESWLITENVDDTSESATLGKIHLETPFGMCARCQTCGSQNELMIAELVGVPGALWETQPCVYDICKTLEGCEIIIEDDSDAAPLPSPEELMNVWNGYVDGDIEFLRNAMRTYPNHVVLNDTRAALQLFGCDGSIVGNLPLTSADISALAE